MFAAAPQFLGVWSGLRDVPFVFNYIYRGRSVQAALSQFFLSLQLERGFEVWREQKLELLEPCAKKT